MEQKEIFISYSRRDIDVAKEIKKKIEKSTSVKCWMDMEGIECGSQFQDVIISAINEARIVILLLSKNSMQSHWVKKEVNYANEKHKKVVPINIDGSQPGDWFLFTFSGNDVIDFRNKDQQQKFYKDIVGWCSREPEKPKDPSELSTGHGVTNPMISNTEDFNRITKNGFYVQYFIWGVLGLISLWLTVTGALRIGNSILSLVLDVLIAGTLLSTFYLSKTKKWAFYAICLLDFLEIFIVCKMGTAVYNVSPRGGFSTGVYTNLWGLGTFIAWKNFTYTYALLSIASAVHISIMAILLKLKNNNEVSGWALLKMK